MNAVKKKGNSGISTVTWVAIVLGLAVAFIGFMALFDNPSDTEKNTWQLETESPTPRQDYDANDTSDINGWGRAAARSACHDQVEEQLKAPSTADFEGLTEAEFSKSSDGRSWKVSGWVDSENGFGANIRTDWTCTVTPSSKDSASVQVSLN